MSEEAPPDEGPVTDPQELERVMKLAVDDVAMHGPFFRLLMEARLWIFVPPHPELVDHVREASAPLAWMVYNDGKGPFAAVFTSERAADERAEQLKGEPPMMLEMPARVLFAHLNNGRTTVLLAAANGATFRLPPEAVKALMQGEFTEYRPSGEPGPKVRLQPLPPAKVPSKLREAIRVFCTQRQGAIAVYVFHPVNPETGQADGQSLRVYVRLRDEPGHFFNDFRMIVARSAPDPLAVSTCVIGEGDSAGIASMQRCPPVWPVMARGVAESGTNRGINLMSEEDLPDEGPVTDPQELERVMKLAVDDVAMHGPFFRLLMGARRRWPGRAEAAKSRISRDRCDIPQPAVPAATHA